MSTISYSEERTFRDLTFKWALATDTKSLETYLKILDSEIILDMSDLFPGGTKQRLSPTAFYEQNFSEDILGHPDLQTQHLLGEALFTRVSNTEAKGTFQIRGNHIRKFKDGRVTQWDAGAYQEYTYVKINAEWKIGGWRPHCVVASMGGHEDVLGKDRSA